MEIEVFKIGNSECEHDDWVYKTLNLMNFSFPPTYIQQRICPHCGRIEILKNNKEFRGDSKEFQKVFDKYYKK